MWLEFEGFSDLIREWWGESQILGFASFVVASKLKYLKAKLKAWNREIFGDIRVKKHKLLELINSLDLKEGSFGLSSEELEQRLEAKRAKVSFLEEVSWRQKSRVLWLHVGESNLSLKKRKAHRGTKGPDA